MRTDDAFDAGDLERRIDEAIDAEVAALLEVEGPRTAASRVRAALDVPVRRPRLRPAAWLVPAGAVCALILAAIVWQARTPGPTSTPADLVARAGSEPVRPPVPPAALADAKPREAMAPAAARTRRPPAPPDSASGEDVAAGAVESLVTDRVEVPALLVQPLSIERLQVLPVSVERIGGRDGPDRSNR